MREFPLCGRLDDCRADSILGCGDDPVVNPDIVPEENIPLPGRIAFFSDRDGDAEIYMMNADGTSLVRLDRKQGD